MSNKNYLSPTKRMKQRKRAETRFRMYGLFAIILSCAFLAIILSSVVSKGHTAFWQSNIALDVKIPEDADSKTRYRKIIRNALKSAFPEASSRRDRQMLYSLISKGASFQLAELVEEHPEYKGTTQNVSFVASSIVDMWVKGNITADIPEDNRKLKDKQIAWLMTLKAEGKLVQKFNHWFFTQGDSREPEIAGMWGSIKGSFFTIIICMLLAFPLAVLTAVYLEEFAPQNKITDLIEININNLAAVPSIVFGLLALAIFLNWFGLPRSSSIAGGLTLALMVLPTIVITTRNAIKAVPPSIKNGAMALGASPMQVCVHHTIPLAMPGIMTGTILSVARALGETAPLLMIGMVAFIADIPQSFTDAATVMPVQIYLWTDSPELGFIEKTSAAIMVLLAFLMSANGLAVYLRKKFERRW